MEQEIKNSKSPYKKVVIVSVLIFVIVASSYFIYQRVMYILGGEDNAVEINPVFIPEKLDEYSVMEELEKNKAEINVKDMLIVEDQIESQQISDKEKMKILESLNKSTI